ncbi:hypothetical protein GCM10023321_21970 [Pseudonocardia eucalypti]|uniref:Uncharacterized protein n=1 Tax=Pseudonocardia eucalypti TaxID=648755 RepID=A0ABP9PXR9_9PSEU|nr:hypothetical protein [Pseudonocardia eucalypti]
MSTSARLDVDATHRTLRAARYARRAYPGPIGELVERELRAYVETGYLAPADALPARLVTLLTEAQVAEAASAEPEALPARYRPGSPLHWDYPEKVTEPPC